MRVALAISDLAIGGAERNLVNYAIALRERGHDVFVVAGEGPLAHELRDSAIEVLPYRAHLRRPHSVPWAALRLAIRWRRQPVEVFHSFMASTTLVGLLASWLTVLGGGRRPRIVAQVGGLAQDPAEPTWLTRLRLRLLARGATKVLAPSAALHAALRGVGVPERRILDVSFNTVYLARARSDADPLAVRAELGLPADAPVVCSIARLHPLKRQDLLVRAAPRILRSEPRAVFLVVGGGPARDHLEGLARELGVAHAMRFAGERRDVPRVLRACDVVVQTTYGPSGGGPGLTVLEAFAAERPVVAFEFADLREAVGISGAAVLVPEGELDAFADAVVGLVRAPERAREMGRRGADLVRERFSVEGFVERLGAIYADATS